MGKGQVAVEATSSVGFAYETCCMLIRKIAVFLFIRGRSPRYLSYPKLALIE